jgi:hypothetical protein
MSAMDRRTLIAAGLTAAAAGSARAQDDRYPPRNSTGTSRFDADGNPIDPAARQDYDERRSDDRRSDDRRYDDRRYDDRNAMPPPSNRSPDYPAGDRADTYGRGEIVNSASDALGVTAEAVGGAVERIFRDKGRPTAYIAGEEISAAFIGGLRYGKGLLYMKRLREPVRVYWQGPSAGWDFGANGSRCFTLCYNLQYPDAIFRRFPGVEGSAYFIGGLGVNYQRADDIDLAPMRAGVGLRLGANVGYLAYSRQRNFFPF